MIQRLLSLPALRFSKVALFLTMLAALTVCICIPLFSAHAQPPRGGDIPPTPVDTLTVGSATVRPALEAVGTLKAEQGIVVRPEIPGRITALLFTSGQNVKKGAPLVQLNSVIYQARLETSKTRLALSEKTAQRYQSLLQTKVISKEDLDKAMAALLQDRAQVAEARANLDQATIVAPFAGKVGLRKVSLGDYVQAGQEIVTLQSQDPILVEFTLPETQLRQIRKGQRVRLHADALGQQAFTGEVIATESRIDPQTRTLAVQAKVANPDRQLTPGAFVSVKLDLGQEQTILAIPQAAVLYQNGQAYVYRVINQHAVKTDVQLGEKTAQHVVIRTGLNVNDVIIVAGQHKVMPGAPVMALGKPGLVTGKSQR